MLISIINRLIFDATDLAASNERENKLNKI